MTVPAIQTDREAAAKLYEIFPMLATSHQAARKTAQCILAGDCDDWSSVQLFARHRLAAVEQERERCAMVADAKAAKWRREAAKHVRDGGLRSDCQQRDLARASLCDAIASSIRSRNKGD